MFNPNFKNSSVINKSMKIICYIILYSKFVKNTFVQLVSGSVSWFDDTTTRGLEAHPCSFPVYKQSNDKKS